MTIKKRGRRSFKTYARLTLGVVILIGINYTFTKLFDMVFGKSDLGSIIGTTIAVFFFIGFFTLFLWRTDSKGTLAHMMGARDDDE
jgi:peptidoglycan biosynthesis protein MviN/MurJ (putative lipid II flippase)